MVTSRWQCVTREAGAHPVAKNRGRGFTIIESLMDVVEVNTTAEGTEVLMSRRIGP